LFFFFSFTSADSPSLRGGIGYDDEEDLEDEDDVLGLYPGRRPGLSHHHGHGGHGQQQHSGAGSSSTSTHGKDGLSSTPSSTAEGVDSGSLSPPRMVDHSWGDGAGPMMGGVFRQLPGSNIRLRCVALGEPRPWVKWYKVSLKTLNLNDEINLKWF
jgi:hypothetical protein